MNLSFTIRHASYLADHYTTKTIRTFFSLAVSPVSCVLCGDEAGSISLCQKCRAQLDEEAFLALADDKRCECCGRPLLSEHGICTTCREKPVFTGMERVYPLFTYILSKKKLLYSWKIGRQHNLTEVFAGYLADVLQTRFPDAVVVPVPPRPGKIKKTGWDQIEDLALHLEHAHNVRVLRIMRRTEATQQKKLSKEERAEHSRHSYKLDGKSMVRLEGRVPEHVVLLDDVITTGSTINACASVLKEAGIQKISAVSLFIVPG